MKITPPGASQWDVNLMKCPQGQTHTDSLSLPAQSSHWSQMLRGHDAMQRNRSLSRSGQHLHWAITWWESSRKAISVLKDFRAWHVYAVFNFALHWKFNSCSSLNKWFTICMKSQICYAVEKHLPHLFSLWTLSLDPQPLMATLITTKPACFAVTPKSMYKHVIWPIMDNSGTLHSKKCTLDPWSRICLLLQHRQNNK